MFKNLKVTILILSLMVLCCLFFPQVKASEAETSVGAKISTLKDIGVASDNEEKVVISIINFGRNNPFKPYDPKKRKSDGVDLGDIPYPPSYLSEEDEGYKLLLSTVVSGILYDPHAKSVAIVKIKNDDYMLHKGDIVEGIIVENIAKNSITLRYGQNTYTRAVGNIVDGNINYDSVERQEKIFAQTGYKLPNIELEGSI